jgi:hypothetical protein
MVWKTQTETLALFFERASSSFGPLYRARVDQANRSIVTLSYSCSRPSSGQAGAQLAGIVKS